MDYNLKFKLEKETKGALQYKEVYDGDKYIVGTLYVRKSAFPSGFPNELTVTIQGE